ncbi:MAG: tetratricopeptide repeat protein [Acidobacteria bacterium]|nr:tetratricopeptide repeat protein [Acidobacteriota bacterium]
MNQRVAVMIVAALALIAFTWAQQAQPAPAAQPAPSSQPVAKQPQPKSQEEAEAVMAIFNAPDVDSRIKAVETLLTKYADTEFKVVALQVAAATYQQKNDFENMVIYSERTLEADPANYAAMLMLATGIAQRTREFDLDREEKLARVEKYARGAQEALKTAIKPNPNLTDEQWEGAKKDFDAQAHEALALGAMARKKYDVAIAEFKTALEAGSSPDPATMVRLGAVYNMAGQYDNAVAILDKVMAQADVHPQIKQFAQAERARAIQAKGAAKPAAPAATPAPPQAEVKKP